MLRLVGAAARSRRIPFGLYRRLTLPSASCLSSSLIERQADLSSNSYPIPSRGYGSGPYQQARKKTDDEAGKRSLAEKEQEDTEGETGVSDFQEEYEEAEDGCLSSQGEKDSENEDAEVETESEEYFSDLDVEEVNADDGSVSCVQIADMTNVPDELQEMLQDDYEFEDVTEDDAMEEALELLTLEEVQEVLKDVRARDVRTFAVHDRCEWTDMMVVATGNSDRHVHGIADALVYKIKKKEHVKSTLYPTVEGQAGGKWLVVDCGNIVIHVLNEEARSYYRLEDLWTGDVQPSTTDQATMTLMELQVNSLWILRCGCLNVLCVTSAIVKDHPSTKVGA